MSIPAGVATVTVTGKVAELVTFAAAADSASAPPSVG